MTEKNSVENNYIRIENSRLPDQLEVMQKINTDGVCPFCSENLANYHNQPILKTGKHWLITKNRWPYEDTKEHIIAITKKHAETLQDLEDEAGAELFKFFKEIAAELNLSGGGIAMRFGGGDYGSTVSHLHAHLIEPDLKNPNHKGVRFSLSKAKFREQL